MAGKSGIRARESKSACRLIHSDDLTAQPDSEIAIEGDDAQVLAVKFTVIPGPGHAKGKHESARLSFNLHA